MAHVEFRLQGRWYPPDTPTPTYPNLVWINGNTWAAPWQRFNYGVGGANAITGITVNPDGSSVFTVNTGNMNTGATCTRVNGASPTDGSFNLYDHDDVLVFQRSYTGNDSFGIQQAANIINIYVPPGGGSTEWVRMFRVYNYLGGADDDFTMEFRIVADVPPLTKYRYPRVRRQTNNTWVKEQCHRRGGDNVWYRAYQYSFETIGGQSPWYWVSPIAQTYRRQADNTWGAGTFY